MNKDDQITVLTKQLQARDATIRGLEQTLDEIRALSNNLSVELNTSVFNRHRPPSYYVVNRIFNKADKALNNTSECKENEVVQKMQQDFKNIWHLARNSKIEDICKKHLKEESG